MTAVVSRGILEQYATPHGWPLLQVNLLVEGTSDQAYFALASRLYRDRTGKSLIGKDLSVFPVGDGDEGGAFGIQEQFQTVKNLSNYDVDARGKRRFYVAALLDGDDIGKKIAKSIVGANRSFELWRDVFWLQRALPRMTTTPKALKEDLDIANQDWRSLDTVIEDLLSRDLYELFWGSQSRFPRCKIRESGGHTHHSLSSECKPVFRRFVEEHADYQSAEMLIEVVRSLRYYLGLDPQGA